MRAWSRLRIMSIMSCGCCPFLLRPNVHTTAAALWQSALQPSLSRLWNRCLLLMLELSWPYSLKLYSLCFIITYLLPPHHRGCVTQHPVSVFFFVSQQLHVKTIDQIFVKILPEMRSLWKFYRRSDLCENFTGDQIFVKILPEMYLWTRKRPLSFGNHSLLYRDLGIFKGFFNIARRAFFHSSAHISGKTDRICVKIDDSLDNEGSLNLLSYQYLERIRLGARLRCRSALLLTAFINFVIVVIINHHYHQWSLTKLRQIATSRRWWRWLALVAGSRENTLPTGQHSE